MILCMKSCYEFIPEGAALKPGTLILWPKKLRGFNVQIPTVAWEFFFLSFRAKQSSIPECIKKTVPIGLQIKNLQPVKPQGGTHPSPPRSLRRLQWMFSPYSLVNTLGICPWPKWLCSESNTDKNVCVNPTWGAIFCSAFRPDASTLYHKLRALEIAAKNTKWNMNMKAEKHQRPP